jgi:hypothetical protein
VALELGFVRGVIKTLFFGNGSNFDLYKKKKAKINSAVFVRQSLCSSVGIEATLTLDYLHTDLDIGPILMGLRLCSWAEVTLTVL